MFERGGLYLFKTVTPDRRIEVSQRIRNEFESGREYYRHHGQQLIAMPDAPWRKPRREFIDWHNNEIIYKV